MNPHDRVLLLGLDGATFSVLDPLMDDDVMPFLREFTAGGAHAVLESTCHPLTMPAWTTVMTGRSPGNHGIFDFVSVDRGGDHPTYTLATSLDLRAETIWTTASRAGRRVTVLNFPATFPTPDVDGFVVPGFVPWNYLPRAVYPRSLYGRLRDQPTFEAQELAIDWTLERKAIQGLAADEIEDWIAFHLARERQWFEIARYLMNDEPCDLTAVLFDGIDKIQHVAYHVLDPAASRPAPAGLRSRCVEFFHELDGFLEQLVALAGPDATVAMVSDHGFALAGDKIFYANVWLEREGLLAWADGVPLDEHRHVTLEGHMETDVLFDWDRTSACALTASGNGIYIRRSEDYAAFRDRLASALLAIRDPDDGEAVVTDVLVNDVAFAGEHSALAPDLTLVLRDRSFLSVLRADGPLQPRATPYGTHHPDGVFIARGPGIRAGAQLNRLPILTVAPTVLYALGVPIPDSIEAPPAVSAFELSHVMARPVATVAGGEPSVPVSGDGLDEQGQALVFERLRALGYVE